MLIVVYMGDMGDAGDMGDLDDMGDIGDTGVWDNNMYLTLYWLSQVIYKININLYKTIRVEN